MAKMLNKLVKVADSFNVYRYDNGWMVEVGGQNTKNDWTNAKILCTTEQELIDLIKEYNTLDINE